MDGSKQPFRYVPLPAGRGVYLPLSPVAATAGGLALYAPVSPAARGYHSLLVLAARLGLAPAFLRTRSLGETPGTLHIHENRIFDLVRETLHRPDVCFAVYEGKEAITRKPTILAMERSGTPLAFAKIGWNPLTRELVEREYLILTFLQRRGLRFGRFADVLGYVDVGHSKVLLSSPLHGLKFPPSFELTPLHVAFLQEIGALELRRATLLESAFWERLCDRLAAFRIHLLAEQIDTLQRGFELLERRIGNETLPWVLRLGDVVPWNFRANQAANKIEIVDLEFAESESLVGWDLFHFLIGVRGQPAPLDLAQARQSRTFNAYFEHFEVEPGVIPYLQLAYFLDLSLFYRSMWADQPLTEAAERNHALRLMAIKDTISVLTA